MPRANLGGTERRTAERYRVPGRARVFWVGAEAVAVDVSDMSAGGCQVQGCGLPSAGTRVFLSLELGGLPNVRLAATVVRCSQEQTSCGLRFDVPAQRLAGLSRLLNAEVQSTAAGRPLALIVDSEPRSRERVAVAVELAGARVRAVASAEEALQQVRLDCVSLVLARADTEGLAALAAIAKESRDTFRVAFGRGNGVASAVAMGVAEATADDPCSPKLLGELIQRKSVPPLG
jgi:CheY-like chemotaxis protein